MANKMLIDATHEEETRVVVTRGNRVEEFDFESAAKKQLRSNIYLAKVTRVEPSLQAAFVDYGGNRHGFLAFSEIHPDYYQIPHADRQALIEEETDDEPDDEEIDTDEDVKSVTNDPDSVDSDDEDQEENSTEVEEVPQDDEEDDVESVGAEDAFEEVPNRPRKRISSYKIQEVIKRRQILLVQVVKEERGNKGAALTTYMSIAGRYCVLMPNTARGGGISRKITNANDRRRLRKIASELDLPEGMGVILRTAGASRTKVEIKRDYEYLLRLWEDVRDKTLESTAPTLVYEEGSLIKRSIRDLYSKEIEEVVVAGEDGYKEAKSFMKMLMPSHARNVKSYKDIEPIYSQHGVERQLDAMFSAQATLKSGGYLVINQTEALVAIDVNSGRATKEHHIEDTALHTNLEAAEEAARQLRLRDLAGLIVIDFIDMDEKRNKRAVERKLKECLKRDRARIQVGRISHFGLLEMSRQRLRSGVVEGSSIVCQVCQGSGMVRSTESVALHILRNIEDALIQNGPHAIFVKTNSSAALYIFNQKRDHLQELESRFSCSISIETDDAMLGVEHSIEQVQSPSGEKISVVSQQATDHGTTDDDEEDGRKKRRRRKKRGKQSNNRDQGFASTDSENSEQDDTDKVSAEEDDENQERSGRKRVRRGGRGRGRRGRRSDQPELNAEDKSSEESDLETVADDASSEDSQETIDTDVHSEEDSEETKSSSPKARPRRSRPVRRRQNSRSKAAADETSESQDEPTAESGQTEQLDTVSQNQTEQEDDQKEAKTQRKKPVRRRKKASEDSDEIDNSAKQDTDSAKTKTSDNDNTGVSEAEPKTHVDVKADTQQPDLASHSATNDARENTNTASENSEGKSSSEPEPIKEEIPTKPKRRRIGWWQRRA